MKKVDMEQLQKEVEEMKKARKTKRRPRLDSYADLRHRATHILGWARAGGSKAIVRELLFVHFQEDVSADRIYRFVVGALGAWPRSRRSTQGEK